MSVRQHIETYLEGWRLGDAEKSLGATADDFFYDDPNSRRIPRDGFVRFVADFKDAAGVPDAATASEPFLDYRDITIDDNGSPATVWCWWQVRGTELQGSALIKVAERGVLSERIAYYSALPD